MHSQIVTLIHLSFDGILSDCLCVSSLFCVYIFFPYIEIDFCVYGFLCLYCYISKNFFICVFPLYIWMDFCVLFICVCLYLCILYYFLLLSIDRFVNLRTCVLYHLRICTVVYLFFCSILIDYRLIKHVSVAANICAAPWTPLSNTRERDGEKKYRW